MCVNDAAGAGLTPELRRTAARNGGVLHASTQAEPRSGLGLNELLGCTPRGADRHQHCENKQDGNWTDFSAANVVLHLEGDIA